MKITPASSLVEKAKKEAKEMLKMGESIRPIPFRVADNKVFVSTNPKALLALTGFEMDGQFFYIGHKR